MPRILITGSTGFIGANLARRFLRDGWEVHALVRGATDPWRVLDLGSQINRHLVALDDALAITAILAAVKPDGIIHLAAYGNSSWQQDVREMVQVNIEALVSLSTAAEKVGVPKFINTGSSSEYGRKSEPHQESDVLVPDNDYGVTKSFGSQYCASRGSRAATRYTTLRLYSVYGPWEHPRRLLPTLVAHCYRGKLPPLVSPDIARDFVFVDDVVDAYNAAMKAETSTGAIFNIGAGKQTSIRELVNIARDLFNVTDEPAWGSMENRRWDTTRWVANVDRAAADLGWSAQINMREGLRRTYEWYAANEKVRAYYDAQIFHGSSA